MGELSLPIYFMKVVFTSYNNQPGYSNPDQWIQNIRRMTELMEALGKQCAVTYLKYTGCEAHLRLNGVEYIFLRSTKSKYRFPFRMNSTIKKMQADIVIVSGLRYPLQIMQLRWALGKNVKIIARHHADKPPDGFRKILQRYADRSIDAYLFTSFGNASDWLVSGIIKDKQKIFELLAASANFSKMDKQEARQKIGVTAGEIFLWVGRLNANKDPLTVLKGFKGYLTLNPGAKFYMIYQGEDLLQQLKEFIDQSKSLSDAVILKGYVAYDELPVWYSAADLYISGSHSEGGSYALLEAMACGCIPVVTAIPAALKVIGDGEYGISFKPGDANDLANKLAGLCAIDQQTFSIKIEKYFKAELSSGAIATKLYGYCKELLAK